MKKIACPIIGIIIGIILMSYGYVYYSLGLYMISILAIIIIIIFTDISVETKNILQSMILLPLSQIINFSVPQFFMISDLRYILICMIMIIPIFTIIKSQKMSFKDVNLRRLLPIIILIGTIILAILQYTDIIPMIYDNPVELLSIGGELSTLFLIISLLISVFLSDTKYWNKYNSNTLDICSDTLLIVFMTIVTSKFVTIIYL